MSNDANHHRQLIYAKGEMSDLIRSLDDQSTPLGPMSTWPAELLNALNLMLDSGFPMFIWWGPELLQFYNDAYRVILGSGSNSKHPDLLGGPGKDHWQEIWPNIWPLINKVLTTGESVYLEDQLLPIYRDGKLDEVYWTFSYNPIRNANGKPEGILVVCTETTRLNRSQRENAEQREFLLNMSDQLRLFSDPEAMETRALDIIAGHLNADRFGFAKTLIKGEFFLIERDHHRNGVKPLKGAFPAKQFGTDIFETLLSGQMVMYEDVRNEARLSEQHRRSFTELRIEAIINIPLFKNGKLSAVFFAHYEQPHYFTIEEQVQIKQVAGLAWDAVLTARAEQELRLSELRYRTLFESIDEAFMVIEFSFSDDGTAENYRFLVTNPAFEKQTGLKDVVGKTILEIMPDVEPTWIRTYGQVATTGEALRFEEYNEGTGGWYDVYAVAVGKDTNQVVVVFHDITQRKMEEQRKNDFLSMTSHELKTPLTAVTGYLHILKKRVTSDDPKVPDMFERTIKQIGRMTGIINGFLNIAQLEAGQLRIDRTHFDIVELVKQAVQEAVATVSSHHFSFEPTGPIHVSADMEKIDQVIENLISNAVKYSPFGSRIQLTCWSDGSTVKISVIDEGNGIDKADQDLIFGRFYRAVDDQLTSASGFGIGLYICKEIIDRHGGQIGVDSEPGEGSTFWFTLPVAG